MPRVLVQELNVSLEANYQTSPVGIELQGVFWAVVWVFAEHPITDEPVWLWRGAF
jgi:hypothetical protein